MVFKDEKHHGCEIDEVIVNWGALKMGGDRAHTIETKMDVTEGRA